MRISIDARCILSFVGLSLLLFTVNGCGGGTDANSGIEFELAPALELGSINANLVVPSNWARASFGGSNTSEGYAEYIYYSPAMSQRDQIQEIFSVGFYRLSSPELPNLQPGNFSERRQISMADGRTVPLYIYNANNIQLDHGTYDLSYVEVVILTEEHAVVFSAIGETAELGGLLEIVQASVASFELPLEPELSELLSGELDPSSQYLGVYHREPQTVDISDSAHITVPVPTSWHRQTSKEGDLQIVSFTASSESDQDAADYIKVVWVASELWDRTSMDRYLKQNGIRNPHPSAEPLDFEGSIGTLASTRTDRNHNDGRYHRLRIAGYEVFVLVGGERRNRLSLDALYESFAEEMHVDWQIEAYEVPVVSEYTIDLQTTPDERDVIYDAAHDRLLILNAEKRRLLAHDAYTGDVIAEERFPRRPMRIQVSARSQTIYVPLLSNSQPLSCDSNGRGYIYELDSNTLERKQVRSTNYAPTEVIESARGFLYVGQLETNYGCRSTIVTLPANGAAGRGVTYHTSRTTRLLSHPTRNRVVVLGPSANSVPISFSTDRDPNTGRFNLTPDILGSSTGVVSNGWFVDRGQSLILNDGWRYRFDKDGRLVGNKTRRWTENYLAGVVNLGDNQFIALESNSVDPRDPYNYEFEPRHSTPHTVSINRYTDAGATLAGSLALDFAVDVLYGDENYLYLLDLNPETATVMVRVIETAAVQ